MLATMTRTDTEIRDFEGNRVPVPVVGGDQRTLFEEGFEIFAKGTNSFPGVLDEMRTYLRTHGGHDTKLPAMLEPIGLSHHITCRFVDLQGDGVAGVSARPIYRVGGVTYYLPANGTTDESGDYTLPRVFPGEGKLRVYFDNDSVDVDCRIPWTTPTNQVFARGDIVVGEPIDLSLATYAIADLHFYWSYINRFNDSYSVWQTLTTSVAFEGSFTGDTFIGSATGLDLYDWNNNGTLSVTIDSVTGEVTSFDFSNVMTRVEYGVNTSVTAAMQGGGIPMVDYSPGETSVGYRASFSGPGICGKLNEVSLNRITINGALTQTGYACEGPDGVAVLNIRLSSADSW